MNQTNDGSAPFGYFSKPVVPNLWLCKVDLGGEIVGKGKQDRYLQYVQHISKILFPVNY